MGNRAVITDAEKKIGVYLHWNGGRDTIEPLLAYCKLKGYRDVEDDPSYAFARLTQVIANFFGGSNSLGVGLFDELDTDNMDNGTYVIGKDWKIVDRLFFKGLEQDHYKFLPMLRALNDSQPKKEQLDNIELVKYCLQNGISLEDDCDREHVINANGFDETVGYIINDLNIEIDVTKVKTMYKTESDNFELELVSGIKYPISYYDANLIMVKIATLNNPE